MAIIKNFLQRLIKNLSPDVFRPIPTGLLYITLQAVEREIGGECPWDTGDECYKGYGQFWTPACRNIKCRGYKHPSGLIAYTSQSSPDSSVDNRFDFSSFRYLSGNEDDWIPVGTLGATVKFDFGLFYDPGGYGAGFYGYGYYGYNAVLPGSHQLEIGDKWYITCHTASTVVGTDGKNYQCKVKQNWRADWVSTQGYVTNDCVLYSGSAYIALKGSLNRIPSSSPTYWVLFDTTRPITGGNWSSYWQQSGLDGATWQSGATYDVASVVGPAIPDPANKGSYGAVATQGPYRGDHDTIYTVQIIDFWGFQQNFQNAILQISLSTCTDEWLDYWGDYFGIPRLLLRTETLEVKGYEDDETYRARIMKEITRAKGTRAVLMEEAVNFFKSDRVTIEEYFQFNAQNIVVGTDGLNYKCIQRHLATVATQPITGSAWRSYWVQGGDGANTWFEGIWYEDGTQFPKWDGPVGSDVGYSGAYVDSPSRGLWPFEFYINIPAQRAPSAKFVKNGDVPRCICDQACYGDSPCLCDYSNYSTGTGECNCDASCYGYGTCSCDTTCYGYAHICDCDFSCFGYNPCACNATCYAQSCGCNATCYYVSSSWCACFAHCYAEACSCNITCYGYTGCSCDASCYNEGHSCACNNARYGYQSCACDSTCYGYTCPCNVACYSQSCTCYNTCYGQDGCKGDYSCTCNALCYGEGCTTCYATCYEYNPGGCKGDYSPPSCTCESTCYVQGPCPCYHSTYGNTCTCDSMCYGDTPCTCEFMCYGEQTGSCTCNMVCYGYSLCTCDFTCYAFVSCGCDSACYGFGGCYCDATCYGYAPGTEFLLPYGEFSAYSYEAGSGYYYGYGTFVPIVLDTIIFSPPINTGDSLLIGHEYQFSGVDFKWITPGVGGDYTWEYWNGAGWTTLTFRDINTSPLPPVWSTTYHYFDGDAVRPIGSPTGFIYYALKEGDAGGTEPTWPTTPGDTVVDGDTVWICTTGGEQNVNKLRQNGWVHWLEGLRGWAKADNIPYNIPNTGIPKYWVRCRITSVPSVNPKVENMWITYAGQTCRGHYIAHGISVCKCYNTCYGDQACICDATCYSFHTCDCDATCYGHVDCTCDYTDYGYLPCGCDSTCYSFVSCTCNVVVYGHGCACDVNLYGLSSSYCYCFWRCYAESCTCNQLCYGYVPCSCNLACDGYSPCTCDSVRYGYSPCSCDSTDYGYIPCSCDSSCYADQPCGCDATCYGQNPASYNPVTRDKNNCYIYWAASFAKPHYISGLQEIIDRLKTAGTIAIINPLD